MEISLDLLYPIYLRSKIPKKYIFRPNTPYFKMSKGEFLIFQTMLKYYITKLNKRFDQFNKKIDTETNPFILEKYFSYRKNLKLKIKDLKEFNQMLHFYSTHRSSWKFNQKTFNFKSFKPFHWMVLFLAIYFFSQKIRDANIPLDIFFYQIFKKNEG